MPPAAAEKAAHRIPSLDGMRAMSIALVIIAHFTHTLGLKDYNLGSLGVRVFFIISGFLITGILAKELEKSSSIRLRKFYYRRTLRIFPPYYFFLSVLLLFSILRGATNSLGSFGFAYSYLTNYVDPQRWDLGHTWSLSVEEQFYLLYPSLLLLMRKRKMLMLLGLLILISPVVRIIDFRLFGEARWVGMGFHSNADALAIGCALAFFRPYLHNSVVYVKSLNSRWIIVAPIFILLLNNLADHPIIFAVACSAVNLLIALCLDYAVTNHVNNPVGRLLNSTPFVTVGVMSYSIYLWQQLFFDPTSSEWFKTFPFNVFGVTACSWISYSVVERLSLRFRQKWEKKIFPEAKLSSAIPSTQAAIPGI